MAETAMLDKTVPMKGGRMRFLMPVCINRHFRRKLEQKIFVSFRVARPNKARKHALLDIQLTLPHELHASEMELRRTN